MASPKRFNMQQFCADTEKAIGGQEGDARVFWRALSFAVDAHSGQRRKSGEAYVSHPCQVAAILINELGVNEPNTLAAAILHDTVEDVEDVTQTTIHDLFGKRIERIVDGCTKISTFSGKRQTFYNLVHRKIFSGAADEVAVIMIKLADRLHNLRTMDSMPRHKRQKIADETIAVYSPLARVMGLFNMKRELYNLALSYKFPRQSQKVLNSIRKLCEDELSQSIKRTLMEEMSRVWIKCDIEVRARGLSAYYDEKKRVLGRSVDLPVQIIVVVDDLQSCYRALGVINQIYPPIPRTIRDFIANPKPTGYQSLHAKANIGGQTYLFKIRTHKMLDEARGGIVKNWVQEGTVPSGFEKEIREMFDILGSDDSLSYRDMIAAGSKTEMYTYTPKGDCLCLPRGSLVLDFAYKIHTEVGKHCIAAMVGQKKVGPEYVLHDGDRVTILTSKKPVRFHPDILQYCQSPKARSEIARLFRMRVDNLAGQIGESMLRQELKRYGIPREVLSDPGLMDLCAFYGFESIQELYQQLGKGRVRLPEIIYEIRHGLLGGKTVLQRPTGAFNSLQLVSLDPASIKLSQCCNPIPIDHGLIGFVSERGLSVHRKDCKRLKTLRFQREDAVSVRWNLKQSQVEKEQTLLVLKAPRNRLLMMLGTAPVELKIIEIIALSKKQGQTSDWEIRFSVENLFGLRSILHHCDRTGLAWQFELER